MKRGTPRHPKVIALAEQLGVEVFAAVGILELLWHFTAEFSPGGDIGRHSNAAIAKALFWRHKPDKLIQGLISTGWVDAVDTHRLVTHDWKDYCARAVHDQLARDGSMFWDGSKPRGRKPIPPHIRILVIGGRSCVKCGSTKRMSVDHIVPLSKGGTDDLNNLQPMCLHCNVKKGARLN